MLDASLKIFAAIASLKNEQVRQLTESYVEIYLSRILSPRVAKQKKEEFSKILIEVRTSSRKVNLSYVCRNLNRELSRGQRVMLLINFIEFVNFTEKNSLSVLAGDSLLNDFIAEVSDELSVSRRTLQNCEYFVTDQYFNIPDQELMVFAKDINPGFHKSGFLPVQEIKGFLAFLYIEEADVIIFKYNGSSIIELNSRFIFPKNIYAFQSGSVITHSQKPIVYYGQIIKLIKKHDPNKVVTLRLEGVSFTHKDSAFGLKNISFACSSGELIGVMGGSGSGKTTLLNVINGTLKPHSGAVLLNGNEYRMDKRAIQKHIGFVPQDDSLIGELTVFENLYYTTLLSSADVEQSQIEALVENKLSEFSLYHIRNQQVGLPVKRKISGGQRKRLNILSELVREPDVLLVDEPTSGLSSSDSYKILISLNEQASKGRLVIVNIHQPSSEIFRLFDKVLILDQGGYMAYYGNPIEAIEYFKKQSEKVDGTSAECITCHNIKPDEIFNILEARQVDEHGEITDVRKRKPEEWSNTFNSIKGVEQENVLFETKLPNLKHSRPSLGRQFSVYLKRFVLSKIRDYEFLTYSIAIPILLALIISFFSKYFSVSPDGGHVYRYYNNENIPVFFLMSFIACLFTGIILTADCMIRDSLIRKRERFLFLSKVPYINSKVVLFAGLSVIQSAVFTLISSLVLQIPSMVFHFWLILFMASILGNITGILLSSIIKSAAAAYIIIPFLIIPQIVFSGIAIPFSKLNFHIASSNSVPLIGDLTLTRWGIEALLVNQFKDNEYEMRFFDIDTKESQTRINAYFLIPEIIKLIDEYQKENNSQSKGYKKMLINDGLEKLGLSNAKIIDGRGTEDLEKLINLLYEIKENFVKRNSMIMNDKNNLIKQEAQRLGSMDKLIELKNKQTNKGIEKYLLNRQATTVFDYRENSIVQNIDPVFMEPSKGVFNPQFFSARKYFAGFEWDSYAINMCFLIAVFFCLYFSLIVIFHIKDI